MNDSTGQRVIQMAILIGGIAAPFLFPDYRFQIAVLWIMILFALTWDVLGGQMGYNSLGNIFFFGAGMYICAVTQIGLYADVGEYTAAHGAITVDFTPAQYFTGLFTGLIAAALGCVVLAVLLSWVLFGLRGPYFAIGTLGMALAARELVGAWTWIGGGSGIAMPVYPGGPGERSLFVYTLCLAAAVATFVFLRWLYTTRFGLAINAIRDDEEKAEAMGIHTKRHKTVAWSISAFFLGISGGIFGNMTGFVEPAEVAFPAVTFGIFMVAMTLLGGKGTLWGPVIGATLFHTLKEVTWTYLLGWQWIALGLLIIVNVVFFQQGIVGWVRERWPERFGAKTDPGAKRSGRGGIPVSSPTLEIVNVSKSFGGVVANDRVSLNVEQGRITGLIGPNGSGKTTLFNSIVGYHPIDAGSIRFQGREISELRVQQIARLGVLRTFQQTRIFSKMDCVDNMLISVPHRTATFTDMFRPYPSELAEQAEHLLEFVGLYEKRFLISGDLSFGQQKLLEFAMALMNEPKVLLLDEPTAGINPTLINGLIDRLRRANEQFGITLFVIEHNMRVIMNLAEHIYCLAHGELLAQGTPDTIQNDQRVIDAYLGAH